MPSSFTLLLRATACSELLQPPPEGISPAADAAAKPFADAVYAGIGDSLPAGALPELKRRADLARSRIHGAGIFW